MKDIYSVDVETIVAPLDVIVIGLAVKYEI